MTIDGALLRDLRVQINAALATVGEKNRLTIKLGNESYDGTDASGEFQLHIVAPSGGHKRTPMDSSSSGCLSKEN
jgi:hypothetical protein